MISAAGVRGCARTTAEPCFGCFEWDRGSRRCCDEGAWRWGEGLAAGFVTLRRPGVGVGRTTTGADGCRLCVYGAGEESDTGWGFWTSIMFVLKEEGAMRKRGKGRAADGGEEGQAELKCFWRAVWRESKKRGQIEPWVRSLHIAWACASLFSPVWPVA